MEPSSDAVLPELPTVLRGSCRCGRCIYTSKTLPVSITFCHCVECRKASGSPFLSFGLFHNTALHFRSTHHGAEAPIKQQPSHICIDGTPIAIRGSYGSCGSPLFMRYHCRPDGTSVVIGLVDEASVVGQLPKPKEHIFLQEKAKWFSVYEDDGLARHNGFNEPFQNRFKEWVLEGCPRRADTPERALGLENEIVGTSGASGVRSSLQFGANGDAGMSQNPVLNPLPPHPLRNSPKHKDSSQPANTPLPRDSEAPQRLEDTIPDNGLRAWLQCAGSFFLLLASFGLINSFGLSLRPLLYPHFPSSLSAYPLTVLGVFQTYYQRTLLPTSTPFQIAWIGSLQAALLISLRIIAGPFYDRGYLRSLLVVGGVLLVVGMLMTGLCSQYWQLLLAQGVMVGLGSGCLFLPSIAVLPQYFKKKRALATGIGSSGSAIGAICFPIMFNKLEPRIGFRYATWLIALVILVSLVIPIATIRMRELPKEARPLFDARALREGPFLLWGGYLFVSLLGLYLPSFFIQLYGIRFVNASLAFDLLPVLNAGSFFGRLVPLYIADKIGPLNVEILLTIAGSILAFSWLAVCDAAPLFIFSALYGFFAGAITTVTAVIDAALCPTLDVVGVRMGMLLVPWALGLLVGEPIAGAILASGGGWMGLQIFAGAVIVAAVALGIAVRVSKYGWGLRTKC